MTSTSRSLRFFVLMAGVFGAGALVHEPAAQAQTLTTGLQANGSECVTFSNDFTLYRSEYGLYNNTSSDTINVECPIIDASDDSYPSFLPVRRVEVHYRGSTAPTCHLEARDITGGIAMSPNLTATTSPLSGLPVLRMSSNWNVGSTGSTASFTLSCSIPVDTWIVGMTAVRDHHRIEGGI